MSFILNAIKVFFLFLAECIFDIGISVYSFIITLAETNFFTQDVINSFASRIYVLLGIFMLFKVSFSLVNYIVNPDSFTDKQKGIGKLVPNIMITLVLIVFTPRIFGELMDLQKLVIKEQLIDKIIFGSTDEDSINLLTNTGGERIAIEIFNSFYYFEDKSDILANSEATELDLNCDSNGKYCRYIRYHDAFSTYSDYNAYDGVWDETATYHEFLAIIAAVIFVLVMIQFCFDIAIRTVKLGFLQLIAPIPIMSRIDPKSGKDGMFSRWLKECRITYLNLFIRLIALDFAIVIIQIIMTNYDTNMSEMGFMVKVFLILGTLMFAKQLPKLIKNLFPGFDLDGGFTLNPMKRIEKDMIGGKALTGATAGLIQGGVGAVTGAGVSSLLTGTLGGAFRNKGFTDAWNKQKSTNRNMRTAIMNGSTFGGRMSARVVSAIGAPTRSESLDAQVSKIDEQIKDIDNSIKPAKNSIADRKGLADKVKSMEDRAVDKIKNGEAGRISQNYSTLVNRAEELREKMRNGTATAEDVAKAEMAANDYLNNMGKEDYMDNVMGICKGARAYGNLTADTSYEQKDAAMTGQYEDYKKMIKALDGNEYKHDNGTLIIDDASINSAKDMHSVAGQLLGSITYDNRETIGPANARKQELEEEKAKIYDSQRTARANQDAIK